MAWHPYFAPSAANTRMDYAHPLNRPLFVALFKQTQVCPHLAFWTRPQLCCSNCFAWCHGRVACIVTSSCSSSKIQSKHEKFLEGPTCEFLKGIMEMAPILLRVILSQGNRQCVYCNSELVWSNVAQSAHNCGFTHCWLLLQGVLHGNMPQLTVHSILNLHWISTTVHWLQLIKCAR